MNDPAQVPRYLVVDASVSLKWVLDDEAEVAASVSLRDDATRNGIQVLAPSLWIYEVANALVVARRRDRIDRRQSRLALGLLQDLDVRLVDPAPEECLEFAENLEISAYDSAYVALAHAVKAQLWTGDRRLFEQTCGKAEVVRWIGDYGPPA